MNWLLSDFPMGVCSITAINSCISKMTYYVLSRNHKLITQLTGLYECYLLVAILYYLNASAAVSCKSNIATFQMQNVFVTGTCKR